MFRRGGAGAVALILLHGVPPAAGASTAPVRMPAAASATGAVGGVDADGWSVHGARRRLIRDPGVPGGAAIAISAPRNDAEPWASGAQVPLAMPIQIGETITAVTWLRAAAGSEVVAQFSGNAPPYPAFFRVVAKGTGGWQKLVVRGVAPASVAPGTASFTLQLGRLGEGALGPAFIVRGTGGEMEVGRLAAAYRPVPGMDLDFPAGDGVVLAGTLRLPRGSGPFPLVVTVPGSGPQTRGGFTAFNKRLFARGIATFEYDKRGNGGSGGTWSEAVPDLARDLTAALRFLRTRAEVDPRRIALLGGSQGGSVVARAAAGPVRDLPLRGVALMVSPVASTHEVVIDQVARQLRRAWPQGGSYADQRVLATRLLAVVRRFPRPDERRDRVDSLLADAVRAGRIPQDAVASLRTGFLDTQLNAAVLDYRPAAALARLRMPVLAVYAGDDLVVEPVANAAGARRLLRANPAAEVVTLPGLDHMLQVAHIGATDGYVGPGPPFSAPAALDLAVSWLAARLGMSATRPGSQPSATAAISASSVSPSSPVASVRR